MYTDATSRRANKSARSARVEVVDNWHSRWQQVLAWIATNGQLEALLIDSDGWLSARQVLLVAFSRGEVAGHLCFRLAPCAGPDGKARVEARVDAFAVAPGAQSAQVASALKTAALKRCKNLRCLRLVEMNA